MKEAFIDWRPQGETIDILAWASKVMEEYEAQGYRLTLRQLYYQLVSREVIANKVREYKRLGNIISNGRLSGLLDWAMIEDRVRIPALNAHWDSPKQIMEAAINSYYRNRWENQSDYIEVWCEKDAVSNIIEPVCRKWDVLFMANRGYSSQSAMYDAYNRLFVALSREKDVEIIYLGDHDPSGIDMTDDISNRLGLFLTHEQNKIFTRVNRIALNMDQVEKYRPPENPAKVTDSRYEKYVAQFGKSSWELDALEPRVLSDLVEGAIFEHLNHEKWEEVLHLEEQHKEKLRTLAAGLEE